MFICIINKDHICQMCMASIGSHFESKIAFCFNSENPITMQFASTQFSKYFRQNSFFVCSFPFKCPFALFLLAVLRRWF